MRTPILTTTKAMILCQIGTMMPKIKRQNINMAGEQCCELKKSIQKNERVGAGAI